MVLTSFAGALVAALHLLVLAGFAVGKLSGALVVLRLSTTPITSACLVLLGLLTWLLFYLAALPAHREAGDALRSIIDIVFPKFIDWAKTVEVPPSSETIKKISALDDYLKRPDRSGGSV